jgi:protein phosphatase
MNPSGGVVPAIEFCARTHVGRVRTRNEDAMEFRAAQAWAILADGMGGYHGGDVASRITVAAVLHRFELEAGAGRMERVADVTDVLTAAAQDANVAILRASLQQPELAGMGSTVVMAAFVGGQVVSVHVGDSRLYCLHRGSLAQLTRDHTMLQEQIDGGMMSAEDASRTGFKGMLTRGLGVSGTVMPEAGVHPARRGDLFLLCSDGLTDMVPDRDIAAVLDAGGALEAAADRLVELANRNGGHDNVSVILARLPA